MTQPTSTAPSITDTGWAPPGWAPPTTPPSAPTAKRKIGRWIAGGVVLLFIVAAVAGNGDQKDSSTTSDGVVATTATTSSPTAATSASRAETSAMSAWATRYGSDDADMLGSDLMALSADADAMDISGLGTSCRTFQRHLTTAKSHLPTPDAQLTSSLTKAYGYFTQATTACISGIANLDPDELGQVASYLGLGSTHINAATARISALS